jgi:hypothetical protein
MSIDPRWHDNLSELSCPLNGRFILADEGCGVGQNTHKEK